MKKGQYNNKYIYEYKYDLLMRIQEVVFNSENSKIRRSNWKFDFIYQHNF